MRLLRDLVVYAAVVWLMILGFGMSSDESTLQGVLLIAAALLLGGMHLYLTKVQPFLQARSAFCSALIELGFRSAEELESSFVLSARQTKGFGRFAMLLIRQHGNSDISLSVNELYFRKSEFGLCVAGQKQEAGAGLHFDFFICGILADIEQKEDEARELVVHEAWQAILGAESKVPAKIRHAIRQPRFDGLSVRGASYVIDLEPREVLHTGFRKQLARQLSELEQLSEASSFLDHPQ